MPWSMSDSAPLYALIIAVVVFAFTVSAVWVLAAWAVMAVVGG